MKVELLSITPDVEKHIELCGRNCYQSQDKITEDSSERFIKMIIKAGHESVLEVGVATFKLCGVSRALMAQITRHRHCSFQIKSQRYCREDQFEYIIPDSISADSDFLIEYHKMMSGIQKLYNYYVSNGVKPEDARALLPNACTTDIVITANLREWRHILKERLAPAAQFEIREMSDLILAILKEHAPTVFYDF